MKDYSKMTEYELLQEKAKIDIYLRSKEVTSDIDSSIIIFYNIIASYLKETLSSSIPSLNILRANEKTKKLYKQIEQMKMFLDDWSNTILKRKLRKKERLSIYNTACVLIGEHLVQINVPISLASLVNNYNSFPGLIERAFPGYIKSGMIDIILNAKIQQIDEEDLI